MHDTALSLGKLFFDTYAPLVGPNPRILDVGSMNVNGTLRDVAPKECRYLGLDIAPGDGVDVVSKDPCEFPFERGDFDLVVSTSCFEHDGMFWNTITEMLRVVRHGGYVYINAPSNGIYHAHPLDCWRFYPDAGVALSRWADEWADLPNELVESFIARRGPSGWNDCVMVFGRSPAPIPRRFMCDQVPSYNARKRGMLSGLIRGQIETEEQQAEAYLARGARELLERWLASGGACDLTSLTRETKEFLASFGVAP